MYTDDPESGINRQLISIATDALDRSRLFSATLSGAVTNYTSPVLSFTAGQPYYMTLYYTNGAGLENIITSQPLYYDTTPPDPPLPTERIIVLPNFGMAMSGLVDDVERAALAVCVLETDTLVFQFGELNDTQSGIER